MKYRGALAAPEIPEGLEWLNTACPVRLAELRGKIVILEFWTYCCVNCRQNSAHLSELRRLFPHELVVVGVHCARFESEKSREALRQAILRFDILYPVVSDPDFQLWKAYNVGSWPTIVLLDPLGGYVLQDSGPIDTRRYQEILTVMVSDYDRAGILDRAPLKSPGQSVLVNPEELREPARILKYPARLCLSPSHLYLSDTGHHRVLEIELEGDGLHGSVSRVFGSGRAALVDGSPESACFASPRGLALRGSTLIVADTDNHAIRQIDLESGQTTTLAGTGQPAPLPRASQERGLHTPWAVAVVGDLVFIAMSGYHQIWVMVEVGLLGPYAGQSSPGLLDGPSPQARFNQPRDLVAGPGGLYVADAGNSRIRRVSLETNSTVETLATDGPAALQHPAALAPTSDGSLYLADTYNHQIKRLDPQGRLTVVAGTGEPGLMDGGPDRSQVYEPEGLALSGNRLYIADTNNHCVRVLDLANGQLATLDLDGLVRLDPTLVRARPPQVQPRTVVAGGPTRLDLQLRFPPGYRRHPEMPLKIRVEWDGKATTFKFAPDRNPELVLNLMHEGWLNLDFTVYYHPEAQPARCLLYPVSLQIPIHTHDQAGTAVVIPYQIPLELHA